MDKIAGLFSNYALNVSLLSWATAQVIKTILNFITTKKFDPERLVGAGGMPSAHSASMCSLTIAVAKTAGFTSPLFAVAFMISAVVMYDAMGVRRAAGEHARIINLIVKKNRQQGGQSFIPANKEQLKEFLGHTPLEVLGGAMLGILIATIIPVS